MGAATASRASSAYPAEGSILRPHRTRSPPRILCRAARRRCDPAGERIRAGSAAHRVRPAAPAAPPSADPAPGAPLPPSGARRLGPTRFLRLPLAFPVSPQRPRGACPTRRPPKPPVRPPAPGCRRLFCKGGGGRPVPQPRVPDRGSLPWRRRRPASSEWLQGPCHFAGQPGLPQRKPCVSVKTALGEV